MACTKARDESLSRLCFSHYNQQVLGVFHACVLKLGKMMQLSYTEIAVIIINYDNTQCDRIVCV